MAVEDKDPGPAGSYLEVALPETDPAIPLPPEPDAPSRETTSPAIPIPGLAQRALEVAASMPLGPSLVGVPSRTTHGEASEWTPRRDEHAEPAAPGGSIDGVGLEPDLRDRAVALRAAQDEVLRARCGSDVVVMFSELVGSTSYDGRQGEVMGRQRMLTQNAVLFPIIRAHEGTVIKTLGDAIMACFGSTESALGAAVEMQRAVRAYNRGSAGPDDALHIRIGLSAGPVMALDGDLHGDPVDVAARIQSTGAPGDVLVSEPVVTEGGPYVFECLGEVACDDRGNSLRVHRLRTSDDEPLARPEPTVLATRYRLQEELGRGPVGVVYAAQDVRLRVPVTVKLLHPFVREAEGARERFVERVHTMASLLHGGIVRVLDSSPLNGEEMFYVSDRIDGPDLALWVARNGCPEPRRAVRMVRDIAEAVAFAHRRGVLHGGIKPENVLIGPRGRPKLADFGVGDVAPPQLGRSVSSPAYLAPEQVTHDRTDARTDVYGLGAVLYFLLTGRPPNEPVASFEALRAAASGVVTPLSQLRPDLPEVLLDVCASALLVQPSRRFRTVDAFLEALEPLCQSRSPMLEDLGRAGTVSESTFVGHHAEQRSQRRVTSSAQVGSPSLSQEGDVDHPEEITFVGPASALAPKGRGKSVSWTRDPRTLRRSLVGAAVVAVAAIAGLVVTLSGLSRAQSVGHRMGPRVERVSSAVRMVGQSASSPVASPGEAPSSVSEGALTIEAPDGSTVLINGQPIGTVPQVRTIWLTAGTHELSVSRPGARAIRQRVTIVAGKTLKKVVRFDGKRETVLAR